MRCTGMEKGSKWFFTFNPCDKLFELTSDNYYPHLPYHYEPTTLLLPYYYLTTTNTRSTKGGLKEHQRHTLSILFDAKSCLSFTAYCFMSWFYSFLSHPLNRPGGKNKNWKFYEWDLVGCMGETPTHVWVRHQHLYGWDTSTAVGEQTGHCRID